MEVLVNKFWCLAIYLNYMEMFATPSPSDMLIIRHGRSRVRHSTEKDHIRWGLKAFDLGKMIYTDSVCVACNWLTAKYGFQLIRTIIIITIHKRTSELCVSVCIKCPHK